MFESFFWYYFFHLLACSIPLFNSFLRVVKLGFGNRISRLDDEASSEEVLFLIAVIEVHAEKLPLLVLLSPNLQDVHLLGLVLTGKGSNAHKITQFLHY